MHSNGKPGVVNRSYPISVRFVSTVEVEIPVFQLQPEFGFLNLSSAPSAFGIVDCFETRAAFQQSAPASDQEQK